MQRLRDIYSSRLVATLQAGIEKRLARCEEMGDFKLATTLDPRFKLDWCQNDESWDVRDLLTSNVVQLSPTTPAENNAHTSPQPKGSRLMNCMANQAPPSATTQLSSGMEVTSYLAQLSLPQDLKPLNFRKENKLKYLILSKSYISE